MNCLDCSTRNRVTDAVGVCTTCGAGVCGEHLSLDSHNITAHHGMGTAHHFSTRAVTCAECAPVMSALHHENYRPSARVPQTTGADRR